MPKTQKRNFTDNIKYFKKEERDKLKGSIDNYRDKLIIGMLYATGMRVGELIKLRIEDIDFNERFITIPAKNTKTKTSRTAWISQEVLSEIKAYLKLTKRRKGRLFSLTPRRIQQLLKNYSEEAGVKATPHTLRHSHIVHALLNKVPITAIQKQVGHKRLTTAQIYSDFAPEQVREAYEGIERD
ncbi:MAG: site-specific integrase [Candidatus Aerophobetes bacterium]|nr:site-specific integrase [Candidatus Aerophobetes bacterium]